MQKIRKHLSPGVVLGALALAVALGGTSFAGPGKPVKKVKVKISEAAMVLPAHSGATNYGFTEGSANCPGNTRVVGGGISVANAQPTDTQLLMESHPVGNQSWSVRIDNDEATARVGTVYALCLKVK